MKRSHSILPRFDSAFWANASRFLALAAVFAAVLARPFELRQDWFAVIWGAPVPHPPLGGFSAMLRSFFRAEYSPSVFREVFSSWLVLGMLAAWVTSKLLSGKPGRRSQRATLMLFLYLGYSLLSMFWAPHFGLDNQCAYAGVDLAVWVLFLVALMDLPPCRWFNRAAWIVLAALALVLVVTSIDFKSLTNSGGAPKPVRIPLSASDMIAKSPLWGHGLDSFSVICPRAFSIITDSRYNPDRSLVLESHNDFLEFMTENGIIGFVILSVFSIFFCLGGFQRIMLLDSPCEKLARSLAFIIILAVAVWACFTNPMNNPAIWAMFLISCALFYGPEEEELSPPESAESPTPTPVGRWRYAVCLGVWAVMLFPFSVDLTRLKADRLYSIGLIKFRDAGGLTRGDKASEPNLEFGVAKDYFKQSLRLVPMDYKVTLYQAFAEEALAKSYQAAAASVSDGKMAAMYRKMALSQFQTAMDNFKKASRMAHTYASLPPVPKLEPGLGKRLNNRMLVSMSNICQRLAALDPGHPEYMVWSAGYADLAKNYRP